MNFFDPQCQEPALSHTQFGLCDDENGERAYTNLDKPDSWIATVKNDKCITLVLTAIDKCVIKDGEEKGRGRCDAMLTSNEHLYFIELKNVDYPSWKTGAIEQLESTVRFFIANHSLKSYRHKKVFACNKRRKGRGFRESDVERNLRFSEDTASD